MSKQEIRHTLRDQRRKLTAHQQRRASDSMIRHLSHQLFFLRARNLALYLPNDGEIDPTLLISLATAAGKNTFLPILDPMHPGKLCFLPWRPGMPLITNRFGIPEPAYQPQNRFKLWQLDVIFMPLVSFDQTGNRLGMGGGYYDRTLAHRRGSNSSRPLLVGLAHHFQQHESIPSDLWDVPLHAIATDKGVILTPKQSSPEV